jgi:moderate conductance mechanosensitive channel
LTHAIDLQRAASALAVVSVELAAAALLCTASYVLALLALRAIPARIGRASDWRGAARIKARKILLALCLLLCVAVLGYNGWLVVRGVSVAGHTAALARSITAETWKELASTLAKLSLAVAALLLAIRLIRRAVRAAARIISRWDWLKDHHGRLPTFFKRLERAIAPGGWMLVAALACTLFRLPQGATDTVLFIIRLYVLIVVGLVIIRSTQVIVDTLDELSDRYAQRRGWVRQYGHLRQLLPTLRTCLEYALWIGLASLVLVQLPSARNIAAWGPRLIQAIGIFFAGRVIVELGRLEIGHRMLPREGLEETERRRRATMVPLVRSAFGYGAYFGTAVLVLGALGFNPLPFLAGAGLLGLVIGFGAQSLINDVVSGFFILFENIYLVGDTVEVGAARGVVEAIEFRVTKIRDAEGRLHIIRNGDMKPVVNYSKDYSVALVAVEVAYDSDLPAIFASLRQAGERLRAECDDLLSDTEIQGITAFGASTMTVRTPTRVRPGRHEAVAAALRFFMKEIFDQEAGDVRRQTLVAQRRESARAAGHRA